MTEKASHQTPGAVLTQPPGIVEEIEVRGHIVDSLLLPKILDRILLMGGTFEIRECKIGVHRTDPSYARIAVQADTHEKLAEILGDLVEHEGYRLAITSVDGHRTARVRVTPPVPPSGDSEVNPA